MFELSPNNRDQPDEVLLADLREVSHSLGGQVLTRDSYAMHGRFAPATVANRFGGWGRALEKAGLESSRHFSVTPAEAIADLKRVADVLGVDTLSVVLYRMHGKYSEKAFKQAFGGWLPALAAAGLKQSELYHPRSRDEELFENLELVWQHLGRQPTVNDMTRPHSRFSAYTYKRRFGGWRKALEAFVQAVAEPGAAQAEAAVGTADVPPLTVVARNAPRPRSVGWRLRYLVLRRDRFSCRACGRSPATHPGLVLQVDHVIAWSNGGETVEANLQSLCEECNGGKGAV